MAAAAESGAYEERAVPVAEPVKKPPPMIPVASNALLAGIRGGVQLKKTTQVRREPKKDKRDMLLAALRKGGQTGLKKVKAEDVYMESQQQVAPAEV